MVDRDTTRFHLNDLLIKSVAGIQNIRETYASCVQTSVRIDNIISKIDNQKPTVLSKHHAAIERAYIFTLIKKYIRNVCDGVYSLTTYYCQ